MIVRGSENPLRDWEKVLSGEEATIFREIVDVMNQHRLRDCISMFNLDSQAELAASYRYLARNRQGIFALTSFFEPFGLAPLEAMAAGLPVVVTRNGGPAESLQDADGTSYGMLVDPTDPLDIARGILEFATDPKKWKQYQIKGMQRVLDKYTWNKTAAGYLKVIAEILKGKDAANLNFPIPRYFFDPRAADINPTWLEKLYYGSP